MTAVYNQHTYSSQFVGETGHYHERAGKDDGQPMAIDCAQCEPYLVKLGWVYDPKSVPLTDRQIAEQDRVSTQGNAALLAFQRDLARTAEKALRANAADDDDEAPAKPPKAAPRKRAARATKAPAKAPAKAGA